MVKRIPKTANVRQMPEVQQTKREKSYDEAVSDALAALDKWPSAQGWVGTVPNEVENMIEDFLLVVALSHKLYHFLNGLLSDLNIGGEGRPEPRHVTIQEFLLLDVLKSAECTWRKMQLAYDAVYLRDGGKSVRALEGYV